MRLSASANGTRNTGLGGGQYLLESNLFSPPYSSYVSGSDPALRTSDKPAASTADNYHLDGLTDFGPNDLRTMGSWGAGIETAEGYRYVWLLSSDHPADGSGEEGGWAYDACHIYAAFSNDPRIPPDPSTMRAIISGKTNVIPSVTCDFVRSFQARLVYNSDDPTNPAYVYVEGLSSGATGGAPPTNSLNMLLFKGADFNSDFTPVSVSHASTAAFALTSFQNVYRLGTGSWVSWGGGSTVRNFGETAKWTSTDGVTFTIGSVTTKTRGASGPYSGYPDNGWIQVAGDGQRFQIGSDWYVSSKEDLRGSTYNSGVTYAINDQVSLDANHTYKSLAGSNINNNPATSPVWWQDLGVLGEYVALVPVDGTTGSTNFTGTPPFIRISDKYAGHYPDTSYLQYVRHYVEDGIIFLYALHGMFGDTGLVRDVLPENGGGINEQYIDIYGYVFDATAATAAAPFGVRASCTSGVATISWDNFPAGRTYRVRRGTSFGTYGTNLGDVTAASITDSPTSGSVYYYQVTSLHGGVEQASRVVSTYVS